MVDGRGCCCPHPKMSCYTCNRVWAVHQPDLYPSRYSRAIWHPPPREPASAAVDAQHLPSSHHLILSSCLQGMSRSYLFSLSECHDVWFGRLILLLRDRDYLGSGSSLLVNFAWRPRCVQPLSPSNRMWAVHLQDSSRNIYSRTIWHPPPRMPASTAVDAQHAPSSHHLILSSCCAGMSRSYLISISECHDVWFRRLVLLLCDGTD
jgi:hypothetical protein